MSCSSEYFFRIDRDLLAAESPEMRICIAILHSLSRSSWKYIVQTDWTLRLSSTPPAADPGSKLLPRDRLMSDALVSLALDAGSTSTSAIHDHPTSPDYKRAIE